GAEGGAGGTGGRLAYCGLGAGAEPGGEAPRRGGLGAGYPRSGAIVPVPFPNPPGFLAVEDNMRLLKGQTPPRTRAKDGRAVDMRACSVRDLIDAGVLFCGTPDQVYEQLVEFCEYCGGRRGLRA